MQPTSEDLALSALLIYDAVALRRRPHWRPLGCEHAGSGAQVEAELKELEPEEAAEYLQSLGVEEAGLGSLIRATYRQLGPEDILHVGAY